MRRIFAALYACIFIVSCVSTSIQHGSHVLLSHDRHSHVRSINQPIKGSHTHQHIVRQPIVHHNAAPKQSKQSHDTKKYWDNPVRFNSRPSLDHLTKYVVTRATLDAQMKLLIASGQVPVVYTAMNGIMMFMRFNIEMASRLNPVIVIADSLTQMYITSPYNDTDSLKRTAQPVFYIPQALEGISDFKDFPTNYESIDNAAPNGRKEFEMQTWYRWLIVSNTAILFQIPRIFHGDNDAMVCGNMTSHLAVRKAAQGCDVILSVQGDQPTNNQSWLGHLSGHATFWSLPGLIDLRDFWLLTWRHHKATLRLTGLQAKPGEMGITDMTLLYLYFVAHSRNASGWDTGRPQSFQTGKLRISESGMQDYRRRFDFKWNQTRDTLSMPNINNPSLKMCNGLDIIERTALDHMFAFYSSSFSMNENASSEEVLQHFMFRNKQHHLLHQKQTDGTVLLLPNNFTSFTDPLTQFLPYIIGLTSFFGGRAESFDEGEVARLSNSAIYFPVLHYQSSSKHWVPMDACKRLVSRTQYYVENYYSPWLHRSELEKIMREPNPIVEYMLGRIVDPFVRENCREMLNHRADWWPYMDIFHD